MFYNLSTLGNLMLRQFSVHNFFSIADTVELSLLLNKRIPKDMRSFDGEASSRLSKITALIGANGSGKSNLLKALAFTAWFIRNSFTDIKPTDDILFSPHFSKDEQPTHISLEFEFEGVIYAYYLSLTKQKVLHESLYCKEIRRNYIFKRDWDDVSQTYQIKLKDTFGLDQKEAQKVRQNASLIATAAQYNSPFALKLTLLPFISNVHLTGKIQYDISSLLEAANFFHNTPDLFKNLKFLLKNWDLGLSDIVLKEQEVSAVDGQKYVLPYGLHRFNDKTVAIPFYQESSGTGSAFVLLSRLLPVLHTGGVAIVDELENDLHPHMLLAILDLFFSEKYNPKNAQLIFSTHQELVLNKLMKEQIVLVEKDKTLNTTAWRLDEVEGVRSDDNFFAKYMAGAYGAVPEI